VSPLQKNKQMNLKLGASDFCWDSRIHPPTSDSVEPRTPSIGKRIFALLSYSLGTIKASQVVVLNKDSVVVTQIKVKNFCQAHQIVRLFQYRKLPFEI